MHARRARSRPTLVIALSGLAKDLPQREPAAGEPHVSATCEGVTVGRRARARPLIRFPTRMYGTEAPRRPPNVSVRCTYNTYRVVLHASQALKSIDLNRCRIQPQTRQRHQDVRLRGPVALASHRKLVSRMMTSRGPLLLRPSPPLALFPYLTRSLSLSRIDSIFLSAVAATATSSICSPCLPWAASLPASPAHSVPAFLRSRPRRRRAGG